MKTITRHELLPMVMRCFPKTDIDGGWFYNQFFYEEVPHLYFSERKPVEKLVAATFIAISLFELPLSGWLAFHDCHAGWRLLPKSARGVQGTALEDLDLLIRQQIYFRSPDNHSDNYNIVGSTGQWAITFCHEGDWYAFHRDRDIIGKLSLLVRKRAPASQ